MDVKFSIIVAVYNIEKYISDCVESIVGQTYNNLEIILVNDGSTDGSLEALQRWEKSDKRIKVVDKPNGGLSSARNEGLKHATGDYVAYIDGDDWIDVSMFETIASTLSNTGNVDMVTFSYADTYTISRNLIPHIYNIEEGKVYKGNDFFEKSTFYVSAWSKVYSREFLTRSRLLFLEGRLHEDVSYTIPLCVLAEKVVNINKVLYYYRQNRSGSIMSSIKERNVNDFIHALCYGYEFLDSRHAVTPHYADWLVHAFYVTCHSHLTTFSVLYRNMKLNNVPQLVEKIVIQNSSSIHSVSFATRLFFMHLYIKFRYIGGRIIHRNRYSLQ